MKLDKRKWMAVIICLAVLSAYIGIRNRSSMANEMKDKTETKTETAEKKVIVVDPGHGGYQLRK